MAFPHLVGNADGGTAYSISDIGSCVGNNFSEDTYFHSNAREDSGALGQGENYPKPVRRRLGGQGWEETE